MTIRTNGQIIAGAGGASTWGDITGDLTDQTDLNDALNAKYDASNPNGYTSNVGTVTSVNNVSPVNGNVTLSIPTVDQTYSAISTNAQSGTAVASAISGKANDGDVVKLSGSQSIADTKTFTGQVNIRALLMKAENASTTEGGQINFESGAQEANAGKSMYIDRYNGIFRFVGVNSSGTTRLPLQVDIQNNRVLGVTPATSDNSTNLATTAFIKNQGYIGSTNLATCHVVVETYVNNTDWYRVYDDGWVEQGGQNNTLGSGTVVTITLLKKFQDTHYFATRTSLLGASSGGNASYLSGILNRTVSTFQYRIDQTAYTTGAIWYACGYGA